VRRRGPHVRLQQRQAGGRARQEAAHGSAAPHVREKERGTQSHSPAGTKWQSTMRVRVGMHQMAQLASLGRIQT
jgi:hypothetical protein